MGMRQRGVRGETDAAADHPELLHEHQPAAVDGVGDRAADHGQRQQWNEMRERDQADGERRARELVHLVRERDLGDLRPDERDALAEPQSPEGGRLPQRCEVESEAREAEAAAFRRGHSRLVRQKSFWFSGFDVAASSRRARRPRSARSTRPASACSASRSARSSASSTIGEAPAES